MEATRRRAANTSFCRRESMNHIFCKGYVCLILSPPTRPESYNKGAAACWYWLGGIPLPCHSWSSASDARVVPASGHAEGCPYTSSQIINIRLDYRLSSIVLHTTLRFCCQHFHKSAKRFRRSRCTQKMIIFPNGLFFCIFFCKIQKF